MSKLIRAGLALGLLTGLLLAVAVPSAAQRAVQLVTPYPGVTVQAGKTVTLNLEVITPTRQRVDLAIVEVPPGWQATLRGGGFVINSVFGGPKTEDESPPQVQLEVRVPPDAAQEAHRVLVRGTSAGASDTLQVDLTVSETAPGAVTLVPEFPSLSGSSTDTFRFNLTLTNNSPDETTFSLSAEGPAGWNVTARPSAAEQATTLTVEGGGTASIQATADPPDEVTADTYAIRVRAVGGEHTAETDLSVEVTGNFQMQLATEDERLNAKARAGRATNIALEVRNTGTAPLTNVALSSTPPTGWTVEFNPESVQEIEPGGEARVTAQLTPSNEALAGDYVVTLSASGEGTTSSANIRVTVQASPVGGIIGALIIIGVLAGLWWVFQRYGRR